MLRSNHSLGKIHGLLTFVNDVLLIPMFTLVTLEICDAIATQSARLFDLTNLGFCALFGAEWVIGLAIAENRWAYLRNPLRLADLVSSIPVGQIFQSVRIIRLLRVLRLVRAAWRARRYQGPALRVFRVACLVIATVGAGALAMRIVEPEMVPDLFTAVWWSLLTVTSGEPGDVAPLTNGGRTVAAFLGTLGVGVFGYVAGFLSTILEDPEEQELLQICHRMETGLATVQAELSEIKQAQGRPG